VGGCGNVSLRIIREFVYRSVFADLQPTDFWQFVFTGHNVLCPQEHVCYCDGFGICFGGKKEYDKFLVKYREKTDAEGKLDKWKEQYGNLTEQIAEAKTEKMREQLLEELGRDKELEGKFERHKAYCDRKVDMAKERGTVAKNRAQEAGRRWREGDGF
jgi:hypothetical protein